MFYLIFMLFAINLLWIEIRHVRKCEALSLSKLRATDDYVKLIVGVLESHVMQLHADTCPKGILHLDNRYVTANLRALLFESQITATL